MTPFKNRFRSTRRCKSRRINAAQSKVMNRARWAADKARRDAEESERAFEMELARVLGEGPIAAGQYVGTLQWSDSHGKVRRWTFRRGERAGSVRIDGIAKPKTVTWVLDRLRRHLSVYFRTGLR